MVPAHLLFMHLNPSVGKDANIVIMRMQNWFIKFIDISLLVMVIYHAGYGVMSVIRDYIGFRVFRTGLAVLVILVMVIFAWAGIRLTISI
jgi:succinate dehydrogenase hydrophobic anchor subunit